MSQATEAPQISGTHCGSVVQYSCDECFFQSDGLSALSKCGSNGTWDVSAVRACTPVVSMACPRPPNSTQVYSTRCFQPDNTLYACDPYFSYVAWSHNNSSGVLGLSICEQENPNVFGWTRLSPACPPIQPSPISP